MRVNEIFYSIQGESSWTGHPCIFVRLSGCNLRCAWCDTTYAFYEGIEMTIEEVWERIRDFPSRLVELTGGEPLLQKEAFDLIRLLPDRGFRVLVETSGSVDIREVDPRAHIILDIKCPGSGMSGQMRWENLEFLSGKDEIKFVVNDRRDFDWAMGVIDRHRLAERCPVLLAPVFGELAPADLAAWILQSGAPVRLQLQLHKLIRDPDLRGV